jgi:lysophospholipase L1-like esterase
VTSVTYRCEMNGRWTQFVALGDSLTEGVGDFDASGRPRGWADRFAEEIARRQGELRYANLAVRGRMTAEVITTQLRPAIALAPDLASVVVGMNDLIRPKVNVIRVCQLFEHLVSSIARTGALVITATLPDPGAVTPLPSLVRRRFAARLRQYNDHVVQIAERYGARCVDLAECAIRDAAGWSEDRLHPGTYGHQRIADEFLQLLTGVRSEIVVRPPHIVMSAEGGREQWRWVVRRVCPWVWRQLTGQTQGRFVTAKHPSYTLLGATPAG